MPSAHKEIIAPPPLQPCGFARRQPGDKLGFCGRSQTQGSVPNDDKPEPGTRDHSEMSGHAEEKNRQAKSGDRLVPGRLTPAQNAWNRADSDSEPQTDPGNPSPPIRRQPTGDDLVPG